MGTVADPRGESPVVPEAGREDLLGDAQAARTVGQLRIPWWARGARVLLLVSMDLLVIGGLLVASAYFWAVKVKHQPFSLYLGLLPLASLAVLSFAQASLYPGFGLGAVETLRRLWVRTVSFFVMLAAVVFALRIPHHYSRMVFFVTLLGSLLLVPLARYALLSLLQKTRWWAEPTVVIGTDRLARRTVKALLAARSFGFRPQVVLAHRAGAPGTLEGLPVLGGLERAEELAERMARVAILVEGWAEESGDLVHYLQQFYHRVLVIRSSAETPVEGVGVKNLGGILGLEFRNQLLQRRNRALKRAVDVLLASVGLVFAAPLIGLSAALVKALSPGPAFFFQDREGLGGKCIRVPKIRTMHADAEERLKAHLASDPAARREWEARFKLAHDPRIIGLAATLLRRFSIDELPQLWSVVKGDMSLVGPRPFPAYHLRRYSPRARALRQQVRPGATGLWQVMMRSQGEIEQQEFYDSYYIRNWSIWLDLYILAKTLVAVVSAKGAY